MTRKLRELYSGNWITNGGYNLDSGMSALESGYADLVMYGVSHLANPDLMERFRTGAPLNEPKPDLFYGGGAEGYNDYPFM